MESNILVEKKLENIESELYNLKSIIINLLQKQEQKKVVKLKGLLKGITVDEEVIKESKKSLFKI
ncbi:MAG: hypothetical protein AABY14_00440 [Nanoarchaeota archaeon]